MKKVFFKGKIRDGQAGNFSKEEYEVVYDTEAKYAYLKEFPKINYESDSYRLLVNGSSLPNDYFEKHDQEQTGYFKFIFPHLKRGDTVIDCGCGAGSMLDLIKGIAGKTIAVEPFVNFHKDLKRRGHLPFSSVNEAKSSLDNKADLALSIHVIEHTEDPKQYLIEILDILKPGGKLIVFTPNLDDILLKLIPETYAPFFYRTVHNYYFSGESLEALGIAAGFAKAEKFYYHEFGFANFIQWLKEGKPRGDLKQVSANLEQMVGTNWKNYLETSGQSYNVGVVLEKA